MHTSRCLRFALSPLHALHMTTWSVKAALEQRAAPLSKEANRRSNETQKMRPRYSSGSAEAASTKLEQHIT